MLIVIIKIETGITVSHDSRFIPNLFGMLSYRYYRGTLTNLIAQIDISVPGSLN
jgi:hypothetical protein